ncbi:MAG: beta-ketoacyl-[acyl-carrier-protein] synthase family protein [Hyphomicrobiaceae bacterium]
MSKVNGQRRVVVTGLGAITPIGGSVEELWSSMMAGRCGVGPITTFPTEDLYITIAGEVKDFDPKARLQHLKRDKVLPYADRYSQFAGAAAHEAMLQSGLPMPLENGLRAASIVGSGAGGLTTFETAYRDLFILKKKATHPLTLLRIIGSSACAHVGIEYGIKGPTFGTVSACSTAAHAIGLLYQFIGSGLVDLGISGASEAVLDYGTMRAWQAMRVLSPEGCFPFSKRRNGTVLGEGAGLLVLEELGHAKARGARILAEIKGFGMTGDARDMVNPDIEGPKEAMRLALEDAGLAPSDIQYLNAHGTATAINDANETRAIRGVFGKAADSLAVSSTKSMHGHLLGAGGAVEAIACIKAINEGMLPPTIGLSEPDPECDLDYVPNEARKAKVTHAMSNSFAFGGLNAVLVFGPPPA